MKLTSIDFDYWYCAEGYDLGWKGEIDSHCGYCARYHSRGLKNRPIEFIACPMITEEDVLRTIRIGTPIYVAESHASITDLILELEIEVSGLFIWNVDHHADDVNYHPDVGYNGNHLKPEPLTMHCTECGTWADKLQDLGATYSWIVADCLGKGPSYEFLPYNPDVVFVCKSTVCLHRSGNRPWHTFLSNLGKRAFDGKLKFIGHRAKELRRQHELHLRRRNAESNVFGRSCCYEKS